MSAEKNTPTPKKMYIVIAPCWKCQENFNVALIKPEQSQMYGPESFSEEEIKIAAQHDAVIKMQRSGTRQESYYANTCPNCGTFIGQHYLFMDYFCAAEYGDYPYKAFDLS